MSDFDYDNNLSKMYFATEIRFDGIGRLIKGIASKFQARPARCNTSGSKENLLRVH